MCTQAKVQKFGKNYEPIWGLYSGSVDTVNEIIYNEDENPNDGSLPQYIIVDSSNTVDHPG